MKPTKVGFVSLPDLPTTRRRQRLRKQEASEQPRTGVVQKARESQSELLQEFLLAHSDKKRGRLVSESRSAPGPSEMIPMSNGDYGSARQRKILSQQSSSLDLERIPPEYSMTDPFARTKTTSSESESALETSSMISKLAEDPNSLFDVFRIKNTVDTSPIAISDAYDTSSFQKYIEYLNLVIENDVDRKFLRHHTTNPIPKESSEKVLCWLRSGEPQVLLNLPSLRKALDEGLSPIQQTTPDSGQKILKDRHTAAFRAEVKAQHDRFCEHLGWDEMQKKLAQSILFTVANRCAKEVLGLPVQVIWEKVKEAGVVADKRLLQVLLYVSATSSTGSLQKSAANGRLLGANSIMDILSKVNHDYAASSPNRDAPDANGAFDQVDEIALCHDLLFEPTEQTINIRSKLLVSQGKAVEADELLHFYATTAELRLRTFTPVLLLHLDQGNVSSALRLFKRMQESPMVHLDAASYVNLLSGLSHSGVFHPAAPPIESAKELGYSALSGPKLLDEIVNAMARDISEMPLTLAKRLYNALAEGFPGSKLEASGSLAPLKLTSEKAARKELIASRVLIDPATGKCPRSGVTLRLIHLTTDEKVKLKETILSLASSASKLTDQVKESPRNRFAREALLSFFQWLDDREGEPFTAIVDAANVAYHLQNFEDGRFSFHQIQFVVDALESMGEHPLVVLPQKYTRQSFYVTIGAGSSKGAMRQRPTQEELEIRDSLIESGKVYVVPRGLLDDYCWIVASVSEQTVARFDRDLDVAPGCPKGRWPGTRPVLITNDQMRDHQLEMLMPVLFRRWYSNYIVNYNFMGFFGETCTDREIGFSPADFFSREIQGNQDPSSKATVWHFPLADSQDEWFCLRIPRT